MYCYQFAFYLTYFFIETYFWKFYIMKFVLSLHKKEYFKFQFKFRREYGNTNYKLQEALHVFDQYVKKIKSLWAIKLL